MLQPCRPACSCARAVDAAALRNTNTSFVSFASHATTTPTASTAIATGEMVCALSDCYLIGRFDPTATRLRSGAALVVGGYGYYKAPAYRESELYDPTTRTWSATGEMS